MRWLRIVVGLLGIAITLCAWLISHHDRFPFVDMVLAPEYAMAMTALNTMNLKGNIVLKRGEVGFSQISETLKDDIQSAAPIVQIKKVNAGQAVIETSSGIKSQHFFDLEISVENGPALKKRFYGLKAKIQKTYLDSPLFRWDGYIFGAGILITLIALFL